MSRFIILLSVIIVGFMSLSDVNISKEEFVAPAEFIIEETDTAAMAQLLGTQDIVRREGSEF